MRGVYTAINLKRLKATKTFTSKELAEKHIKWIEENTKMSADDYIIIKNTVIDELDENNEIN